jgi:High potential iron-sulfur protein
LPLGEAWPGRRSGIASQADHLRKSRARCTADFLANIGNSLGEEKSMHRNQTTGRRKLLRTLLGLAGVFALSASADDAKPKPPAGLKKRSRESVGYRDFPYEKRTCAKCMLYVGEGECVIIDGKVSPDGWCTQWTPPTIGRARQPLPDAVATMVDRTNSRRV